MGFFAKRKHRRQAHPFALAGVAVLVVLVVAIGCKKGGGEDDAPSNKWDEMKWDEGEWGAILTPSDGIPIA